MRSMFCPSCGLEQPLHHVFCVGCGVELPSHLLAGAPPKRAQWFAGVKLLAGEPDAAFLRVSCYLTEHTMGAGAVRVPGRHVRFSVWDGERARCVVSLPETEAEELARFILREMRRPDARLASDR